MNKTEAMAIVAILEDAAKQIGKSAMMAWDFKEIALARDLLTEGLQVSQIVVEITKRFIEF